MTPWKLIEMRRGRCRRVAIVAVALAAAIACTTERPATQDDLVQRETEFAEAVASGDLDRFREFIFDDAVFISPSGSIADGSEAVLADWKPLLDDPAVQLTWKPIRAALPAGGDLGYTYGEWKKTREGDDGSELVGTGRYVTIWRRGSDGVWRVALDAGNADERPRAEMSF